jgi:hypothetical protein
MTHSAGHKGYKASAAALCKDDELYGPYRHGKEDWPVRNEVSTRNGSPRQSADRKRSNMVDEPLDRGNR